MKKTVTGFSTLADPKAGSLILQKVKVPEQSGTNVFDILHEVTSNCCV